MVYITVSGSFNGELHLLSEAELKPLAQSNQGECIVYGVTQGTSVNYGVICIGAVG